MKRYDLDWMQERISEEPEGDYCKYSDVAALESQLRGAQVDVEVLSRSYQYVKAENAELTKQLQAAQARNAELEDKWQQFISGEAEHQEKVCIAECHDKKHGYCYDIQRCGQLEAENAALRADNAALLEGYKKGYFGREVEKILAAPHPGASLLQELASLRGVQNTKLIETEMGYESLAWKCENCKEEWICIEGTPQENGYKYCPACGAKVTEYVALDALSAVKGSERDGYTP